jgi:microcystin-dependent protein
LISFFGIIFFRLFFCLFIFTNYITIFLFGIFQMTFLNAFVCLQLVLLCFCSVFILKLQREIGLAKEMNLDTKRLLERNQDISEYEDRNRRLTTTSVGNCSAVIGQALIPVGTILDFAGSVPPVGFLLCDGSTVSSSKYSALFSVIDITYGIPDVSLKTFNLPDFRGRTSIGSGQGSGLSLRNLGNAFGEETHKLSQAELASHSHTDAGHTHILSMDAGNDYPSGEGPFRDGAKYGLQVGIRFRGSISTAYAQIQSSGGDQPHNNIPPSLVVNKIIKFSN